MYTPKQLSRIAEISAMVSPEKSTPSFEDIKQAYLVFKSVNFADWGFFNRNGKFEAIPCSHEKGHIRHSRNEVIFNACLIMAKEGLPIGEKTKEWMQKMLGNKLFRERVSGSFR